MNKIASQASRLYFRCMAAYWLVFGLITTFYPALMDLFQTAEGVNAKTPFSNHVWFHGGLDIIALCIVLFALSREPVSRNVIRAVALAALMPTIAIGYSLVGTSYWNALFSVAGVGCLAFVIWGFMLTSKEETA
jgi:hypothetical protein